VSVVEVQWFEGKFCEVEPDLRLKSGTGTRRECGHRAGAK
jgi:hypothetical protein